MATTLAVSFPNHEGDEKVFLLPTAERSEGREARMLLTAPEGRGNMWLQQDG